MARTIRKPFALLTALALCLAAWPALAMAQLPLVVVVATGGTIAEKTGAGGGAVPALTGDSLVAAVPGLDKVARIKVVNLCNIDSSQMTPEIWAKLSRAAEAELAKPEVAGVVVTHGTDTMAEGAFFLDLTLKSNKTVVFTGAMRDASDPSPDGPINILNAVRVVTSPQAQGWGVVVALNDYVNAARWAVKTQSTNPQTFDSGQKGYLGYVMTGLVERWHPRPARLHLPLPDKLPKVTYLTTFAGDDGALVRHAVDKGAKGLVVDGVGAGNVNAEVYKAIQYALGKGVKVVITTRVAHGGAWPIYGDQGGGLTMQKAGCILSRAFDGPKARLLLMLALANNTSPQKLAEYFK
ncbi:MAG: asparaginase [Proteobacteria bacterium]|nr:asparaginase [Pseudomonadota bacterium]MBU1449478.1 asparaginase [Pseudomonadota bacterium]MBU2468772.1 asparaginase [Pseudomonadota bacterium]MBU2516565.1 asparaginase [Pseudomonadota bacterium]